MHRLVFLCTVGALGLQLAACTTGSGSPPVINQSPHRVIPAETLVAKGDSLYSIAWDFGLDHRKIARWNGLGAPYTVRPGQRLRLRPGASQTAAAAPAPKPKPKPTPTPQPQPKPTPAPAAPAKPAQPAPSALPATAPGKWNWPAKGELIGKFSRGKGQNGIRIAAAAGSAVRATAAGDVVYAGEGLRGYGRLIIVKHSPSYLSAYAHNRKILVAEGARVKSGQQIAEMGSSGADRTMLHFEIRKDGKPVDPLQFLN